MGFYAIFLRSENFVLVYCLSLYFNLLVANLRSDETSNISCSSKCLFSANGYFFILQKANVVTDAKPAMNLRIYFKAIRIDLMIDKLF